MTPRVAGTGARVQARALAKINLHLAIGRRRPDGYHELTTVFQSIEAHDTITIEAHDGRFDLRCTDLTVPADESNLVWRAADVWAAASGIATLDGVRVSLEKHVPAQAGLGGGSADAVAAMRALASWFGLPDDPDVLRTVGRSLGSDVPFFVEGGTALGRGRGDEITPLPDVPDCWIVVARPAFGIGTAEAYRWVADLRAQGELPPAAALPDWPSSSAAWSGWLATARNDFEPLVQSRFPAIAEASAMLREAGAGLALLSGSGSAVFGLFEVEPAAAAACGRFANRPGWRAWLTRTVSRDRYERAVAPIVI